MNSKKKNRRRAKSFELIVTAFAKEHYDPQPDPKLSKAERLDQTTDIVVDLMTNMLHFCKERGVNPHLALNRAHQHFAAEKEGLT